MLLQSNRWRFLKASCFIGFALATAAPVMQAYAQAYPSRAIRLVVPYPPAGAADNVARVLAQKLSQNLNQSIVVDNRAGASGIIGSDVVAKSAPDGYTLLNVASSQAINPSLFKLPYDTLRDFTPVTMLWISPSLLVANMSLPFNTVTELISYAKEHPGMTFGSAGVGSAPHMSGELFGYLAKVKLTHVPYKGAGAALTDLVGGQIQLSFLSVASSLAYAKGGKVKPIAVTTSKRSRSAPNISTIAESGLPGYDMFEWNALFGPAGVPAAIVAQLHAEMAKVVAAPDVQDKMFQLGAEPAVEGPEQLATYMNNDVARWIKVVKEMNVKAE